MKYSICSTVYNVALRLRESLDSILQYINSENFEIVVVDSMSTDGTLEILKEYQRKFPNFKIIVKKCKRGKGRQIAFENSKGEYIIQVDLDTIYSEKWWKFIKAYEKWEGRGKYALQAVYSGIYPRHLLEIVGGWRNLQYAEDFDLWWRLMEINAFKWYPLVTGENWKEKEPERRQVKNIFKVVYRKYINEKDRFIVRSEYSITDRLKEIRKWSNNTSYYFFWVPVVILSKFGAVLQGIEKKNSEVVITKWFKNMIDLHIHGELKYRFISFPISTEFAPYFIKGKEVVGNE